MPTETPNIISTPPLPLSIQRSTPIPMRDTYKISPIVSNLYTYALADPSVRNNSSNQAILASSGKSIQPQNVSNRKNLRIILLGIAVAVLLLVLVGVTVGLLLKPSDNDDSTRSQEFESTKPTSSEAPPSGFNPDCDAQCEPSAGCSMRDDPTACGACKNAVVPIGIYNLCVESCDSAGSTMSGTEDGVIICEALSTRNVALLSLGTTCEASSHNDENWRCENVMDGTVSQWSPPHDGAGEWIQLNFAEEYLIVGIGIDSRTAYFSQCTTYDLSFDGSLRQRITWVCAEHRKSEDYYFQPIRARSLRIKCHVDCGVGGAQGFRNIIVFSLN